MSEFTRVQMMAGISQDELDELKKRIMDMAVVKWSEVTPEERDRLVHVEVIGKPLICPGQAVTEWVKSPSRIRGEYFEYATWKCETCGRAESCIAPESHEVPGEIPHYTQDLNAAWLIVEKMKEPEPDNPDGAYDRLGLFIMALGSDAAEGRSGFWKFLFDVIWTLTPERICLAALCAYGHEWAQQELHKLYEVARFNPGEGHER